MKEIRIAGPHASWLPEAPGKERDAAKTVRPAADAFKDQIDLGALPGRPASNLDSATQALARDLIPFAGPNGAAADLVQSPSRFADGPAGLGNRFAELATALRPGGRPAAGPDWLRAAVSGGVAAPHRPTSSSPAETAASLGAGAPIRQAPSAVGPMSGPRSQQQMDDAASADPAADAGKKEPSLWDRAVAWIKSIVQSDQDAINGGAVAESTAGKAAGATAGTVAGVAQTVLTANTNSPSEKQDEFKGWISILKSKERGGGHEQMAEYNKVICEPDCPSPDPKDGGARTPDPEGQPAPANAGEAAAREKRRASWATAMQNVHPENAAEGREGIVNPSGDGPPFHGVVEQPSADPGHSSRTMQAINPDRESGGGESRVTTGPLKLKLGGRGVADPPSAPGAVSPESFEAD